MVCSDCSSLSFNMSILHVVPDSIFINIAINQFEAAAPGCSRFVCLKSLGELTSVNSKSVELIDTSELSERVASRETKAIVFHQMNYAARKVLRIIPANKRVAWIGWGFDYYDNLLRRQFPNGLLLESTKKSFDAKCLSDETSRDVSKGFRGWLVRTSLYQAYSNRLLNRINFFSPVLDVEYSLVKRHNRWFKPQYQEWNYGDLDSLIPEDLGLVSGGDVLLGNSATFSNNHLDGVDMLRRYFELSNSRVICPLSYGDSEYCNLVSAYGAQVLSDRFIPLVRFLPLNEYNKLIASCGHVFMFHLRQQGLGNIICRMYAGAKIYLMKANPMFRWFTSRGAVVFAIEDLVSEAISSKSRIELTPLTSVEIQKNRHVIRDHWDVERQKLRTIDYVRKLL